MCSSTRGPAMEPSFVTWPTRKVGTPLRLANAISRPATSRTWVMLPGALPSSGRYMVWMESTTSAVGLSASAAASTRSASVSAKRWMAVALHPQPLGAHLRLPQALLAGHVEHRARAAPAGPAPPAAAWTCRCPGRRPAAPASRPPRRRPAPGRTRRCPCAGAPPPPRSRPGAAPAWRPRPRRPTPGACRPRFASASSSSDAPRAAVRALPEPLRRLVPARLAGVVRLRLRHGLRCLAADP